MARCLQPLSPARAQHASAHRSAVSHASRPERGYHGLYAHLSGDAGHTFDRTVKLDTAAYRDGYSRTPVVELADGRVAYAVTEHHPPANRYTYILFSGDKCRSWEPPVVIFDDADRMFSEPDIAEVAPGELCCILRCGRREYLHGCRSLDGVSCIQGTYVDLTA